MKANEAEIFIQISDCQSISNDILDKYSTWCSLSVCSNDLCYIINIRPKWKSIAFYEQVRMVKKILICVFRWQSHGQISDPYLIYFYI